MSWVFSFLIIDPRKIVIFMSRKASFSSFQSLFVYVSTKRTFFCILIAVTFFFIEPTKAHKKSKPKIITAIIGVLPVWLVEIVSQTKTITVETEYIYIMYKYIRKHHAGCSLKLKKKFRKKIRVSLHAPFSLFEKLWMELPAHHVYNKYLYLCIERRKKVKRRQTHLLGLACPYCCVWKEKNPQRWKFLSDDGMTVKQQQVQNKNKKKRICDMGKRQQKYTSKSNNNH